MATVIVPCRITARLGMATVSRVSTEKELVDAIG